MSKPIRQTVCLAVLAALASLSAANAEPYQFRQVKKGLAVTSQGDSSGSTTPSGTTPSTPSAPVLSPAILSLSTNSLTYPTVTIGKKSSAKSVLVTNQGQQDMTLQEPTVTGPFTATHNCAATLAGGANCAVNVTFAPQVPGIVNGVLTLTSSVGTQTVSLTGTGATPAPFMQVDSPANGTMPFGSVVEGTTSTQTIKLTNGGPPYASPLTVTTSGIAAPYAVQSNNCTNVAQGTSCSIVVGFTPTTTSPPGQNLHLTPSSGTAVDIALSGSGTQPASAMQVVSPSNNAVAFGSVTNGTTGTQTITLKNNGPQYADVMTVTTSGISSPFAIQSNNCTSVAQGASCAIVVTYSANGTSGSQTLHLAPSAGDAVDLPVTATTAASNDANWSKVALLMSADGGWVDSTGKTTATPYGGAAISTTQFKFGSGSMAFNGSTSYVTANSVALGAGAFTVEAWVKTAGQQSDKFLIGFRDTSHTAGIHLTLGGYGGTTAGSFRVGGATGGDVAGTTRIDDGAWHHVAVTRDSSNTLRTFVDGKFEASGTDTTNYTGFANRPVFGVHDYSMNTGYFNGWIDEVRITPGVARYTTSFTAPTAPFPVQ